MSIHLKVINLLLHVILDNTFMENYIFENKQKQVVLFYIFGNLSRSGSETAGFCLLAVRSHISAPLENSSIHTHVSA